MNSIRYKIAFERTAEQGGGVQEITLGGADDDAEKEPMRVSDVLACEAKPETLPDFRMWISDPAPFKRPDPKGKDPIIPASITIDSKGIEIIDAMTKQSQWHFIPERVFSGADGSVYQNHSLHKKLVTQDSLVRIPMTLKVSDTNKE